MAIPGVARQDALEAEDLLSATRWVCSRLSTHQATRHATAQLFVLSNAHVARVTMVRHHLPLLPLAVPRTLMVRVAAGHLHGRRLRLLALRAAGWADSGG